MRTLPTAVGCMLAFGAAVGGCGGASNERTAGERATTGGPAASPAQARARTQFVEQCGSCHTLAAAGTVGSVGPPLDGTPRTAAFIERQIQTGADGMAPNLLAGSARRAVAEYVANVSR